MKYLILALLIVSVNAHSKSDGILKEIKLNSKNEKDNIKKAATGEALITKSEERALVDITKLVQKYKGTPQEPDLLFRKAELYVRRAKSGRFFDLYQGDKSLKEILKPELKQKGSKEYLTEALKIYEDLDKRFSKYPFLDEVLFNAAFASQQLAQKAKAKHYYERVLVEFPRSELKWETHMALGELLFDEQEYTKALTQFKEIEKAENSPLYPFAFYKMAWCHYNLKDTESGMRSLERVLALSKKPKSTQHLRNEARRDLGLFFSDINSGAQALKYFSKYLVKDEIAQTFIEMSELYQRHGNEADAVSLLMSFIENYSKDPLRSNMQVRLINIYRENKRDEKVLANLIQLHQLCSESKDVDCIKQVKNLEDSLLSEWWENWNKKRTEAKYQNLAHELFPLYFQFENTEEPEADFHFAYAEIEFNLRNYSVASVEYAKVAHIESADKDLKHKALYAAIVSYSELKEAKVELHKLLDEYILLYPSGTHISQVEFQKAFLLYEEKEWSESEKHLMVLQKSSDLKLKEKSEDLLFDIYNKKEDFEKLKNFTAIIMKTVSAERKLKLTEIYQQSQLKLIELQIKKGNDVEAANAYLSFHNEHKKSEIASKALEAAIPIFFKNHKFEEAALASESRAVELFEKEKLNDKCAHLDKAMQSWLYIGQIDNALKISLEISEIHPQEQKRKEYLLLAESLTQLLDNKILTFKIWGKLEKFLNQEEKSVFLVSQKKYFDLHSETAEARAFFNKIIDNKIEPYYSEQLLKRAQTALAGKRETEAFQTSKNIINQNGTAQIKAEARYIQAKILESEFNRQSLRASGERVQMVLAMKTEKMDKAITAFGSAISMSESPQFKVDALIGMNNTYKGYISSIENFLANDSDKIDPELAVQLQQVIAAIKAKSIETEASITSLQELVKTSQTADLNSRSKLIPLPNQKLFHVYLPSWDDSNQKHWQDLVDVSTNNHSCEKISEIKSERMLALKFHQCYKLRKLTEATALTQEHLKRYPHSPWGSYYRALIHSDRGETAQAQWFIDLAIKKAPAEILLQYEKGRQLIEVNPEQAISLLTAASLNGDETEESKLVLGLLSFEKERCGKVSQYFENLHREDFKNFTPILVILSDCLAENKRVSEAVLLLEKSLKKSTSVLVLIQRAKIAENFEKNKANALKFYQSARSQADTEELKNSLDQKIKEISVQSSTSPLRTFKEEGYEKRHVAHTDNDGND
jgi:TolA-binding protein